MTFSYTKSLRTAMTGIAFGGLSAVAAAAATLPISADLTITGSVGNTTTSTNFPIAQSITSIGAGQEFSFTSNNLITFISSGFSQTMTGTLGVDISDGQVVFSYSGIAQGVGLSFSLTNIDFGSPAMEIDSASETGSTGIISGVNSTNAVNFSANSISGGFFPFGFQTGTNITQTIGFTTASVVVEQPLPSAVPLPASAPLILAAIGMLGIMRRRKTA